MMPEWRWQDSFEPRLSRIACEKSTPAEEEDEEEEEWGGALFA